MIDVWTLTETALATLTGWPAYANQYLTAASGALPDQFLVYQLISSTPEQSADNVETARSYRMQVTAYSRTGLAELPDIAAAMVVQGFIPGPVRELPYNVDTGHYVLVLEFVYAS